MTGIQFIFIGILFCSQALYGQSDSIPGIQLPDSVHVASKKIIEVPEFRKYDPDTIPLGENDLLITDSYTAMGQPYVYDALHSFHRRRMDNFGGYLNDKINAGLAEIRSKGFNSDLKKLYIQIDPVTLTVYWAAVVGPSSDGKCYMHVDSRGSAGGGLPAVLKQCPRMHRLHEAMIPVKLLEFNENVIQCYDWNGVKLDTITNVINIQQHFYKYYDPQIGNTITLAEVVQKDSEMISTAVSTPKKTTPAYKRYTVHQGDTLSKIAEKHRTSISKIKKANGLRSDMIRVGQTLKIPR